VAEPGSYVPVMPIKNNEGMGKFGEERSGKFVSSPILGGIKLPNWAGNTNP